MIKKILLTCAALIACNLFSVEANEGFYVGGFGGANFLHLDSMRAHSHKLHVDPKVGYTVGGTAGYAFGYGIRTEAEILYTRNKIKCSNHQLFESDSGALNRIKNRAAGRLSTWTYMGNLLYDIPTGMGFTPFLGFGLGYIQQKATWRIRSLQHKVRFNKKETGFAWQFITGVAYPLCENVDVSVEYRLFKGHQHMIDHRVGIGLRNFF